MSEALSTTIPERSAVCIGLHVDLATRGGRRGWRLPLIVEALAFHDPNGEVPRLAVCRLARGTDGIEEDPVEYLDFNGTVLRTLNDPHGHRSRAASKLPEALRDLPYFLRNDVVLEPAPRHHAIDGEVPRPHPGTILAPLAGELSIPDLDTIDIGPLEAAVAEARQLAARCLLRGPQGWYVASDLPQWQVYEYGWRTRKVVLSHRAMASAGDIFAIDRLHDALGHARLLHGADFEVLGEVRYFDPARRPEALSDPCALVIRLAAFLATLLRPQLVAMDRRAVEQWHEVANARHTIAHEGRDGARRLLATCRDLFGEFLWSKSRRHESAWRSEQLRLGAELEALHALLPGPGAP
ncbi:hypothetical protein BHAOGJBA_4247 [Methylobacterium hispanicum]|uniref:Uncharacterized protein n=1 Tax=Methylobacterium hispanicum TaxID=270350 RepID=A0AAV4ZT20_9HYPH|nr:hypothetical protein BHAOGJBA_4247 [Methylobacterium hispanicum]